MTRDGELPDEVATRFRAAAVERTYADGEPLFRPGSRPALMFGVIKGHVRVSMEATQSDARMAAVLGPGQWFGEAPLLDDKARSFLAVTHRSCTVATVTAKRFHELVRADVDVALAVAQLVCSRYRQALLWIEQTTLRDLPSRLAMLILDNDVMTAGLSQEMLASRLGVSRPTVNRLLKRWSEAGLISVGYRSLQVIDAERLASLARRG